MNQAILDLNRVFPDTCGPAYYCVCSDRFARRPVYSPCQQIGRRANRLADTVDFFGK